MLIWLFAMNTNDLIKNERVMATTTKNIMIISIWRRAKSARTCLPGDVGCFQGLGIKKTSFLWILTTGTALLALESFCVAAPSQPICPTCYPQHSIPTIIVHACCSLRGTKPAKQSGISRRLRRCQRSGEGGAVPAAGGHKSCVWHTYTQGWNAYNKIHNKIAGHSNASAQCTQPSGFARRLRRCICACSRLRSRCCQRRWRPLLLLLLHLTLQHS